MRLPKPWRVTSELVEAGDSGTSDSGGTFTSKTGIGKF